MLLLTDLEGESVHQNIARQERVCNSCTMSVLETEYHYLV